jgi:hypothetical protein
MGIDIERRKHVRVPIAEPVYLENATGFTHDVSASGVFFWISGGSYNVGDQIGFSLEMSRPEGRVMVRCRGVIVRIEQYETRLGVAAETRLPYLPWVSEGANRAMQKS